MIYGIGRLLEIPVEPDEYFYQPFAKNLQNEVNSINLK